MLTPARVRSILISRGFKVGDEHADVVNNILRFLMLHSDLQRPDLYYKDLNSVQAVLKTNGIRIDNDDPAILMLAIYNIVLADAVADKEKEIRDAFKSKYSYQIKNTISKFVINKQQLIFVTGICLLNAVAVLVVFLFESHFGVALSFVFGVALTAGLPVLFNSTKTKKLAKELAIETEKKTWTDAKVRRYLSMNHDYVNPAIISAAIRVLVHGENLHSAAERAHVSAGLLDAYVGNAQL